MNRQPRGIRAERSYSHVQLESEALRFREAVGIAQNEPIDGLKFYDQIQDYSVVLNGGHAHRFRDTLAVELLMAEVPIEQVSVLLGHESVRTTQKHYSPWVASRQAQLEEHVKRLWGEKGSPRTRDVHALESGGLNDSNHEGKGMVSRAGLGEIRTPKSQQVIEKSSRRKR